MADTRQPSKHSLLKTLAYDPTDAVFGLDTNGEVFHTPISKGPHWIVAGQTGSGKSVYVNSMMASVMFHAVPDELKIMVIDPKKVEFEPYKGLPYCPIDPVTDMNDAYGLLSYLCWEMDRRYEVLAAMKVRNIEDYNQKIEELKKEGKEDEIPEDGRMAYIICIIDEYADLVMTEKSVEDLIIRLAQKARAAGISLLIATQRPSADIVSSTIKANVPARIGLKTTDSMNSMIVIDEPGCEKLAGYGDSIVKLTDGSMVKVQGPFISDGELHTIFDHLREKYGEPDRIDFKTICVENGLAEWMEDYEDDVPMSQRHIKKPKLTFSW